MIFGNVLFPTDGRLKNDGVPEIINSQFTKVNFEIILEPDYNTNSERSISVRTE